MRRIWKGPEPVWADHNLTKRGIPTPSGRVRWNQSTVYDLLTNPAYTGAVYAGRTRCVDARARQSALRPVGHKRASRMTPPADWIFVAQVPPMVSRTSSTPSRLNSPTTGALPGATTRRIPICYAIWSAVGCADWRVAAARRDRTATTFVAAKGQRPNLAAMSAALPATFRRRTRRSGLARCLRAAQPSRPDRSGPAASSRRRLVAPRTAGPAGHPAAGGQESGAAAGAAHRSVSGQRAGVGRVSPSQDRPGSAGRGRPEPRATIRSGGAAPEGNDRHGRVDPGLVPRMFGRALRGQALNRNDRLWSWSIDRVVVTNGEVEIRYVIPALGQGRAGAV